MVELDFTERQQRFSGEVILVARSMAFEQMDGEEFKRLMDGAIDLWCRHFGFTADQLMEAA